MMVKVGSGVLHVEVQDKHGNRPMCLRLDANWISMDRMRTEPDAVPAQVGRWYNIRLVLDCDEEEYDLYVDGKRAEGGIEFADKVNSLERLVFRTGPWRGDVRPLIVNREPGAKGMYLEDSAGADHKVPLSIYLIDDVKTKGM